MALLLIIRKFSLVIKQTHASMQCLSAVVVELFLLGPVLDSMLLSDTVYEQSYHSDGYFTFFNSFGSTGQLR